MVLLIDEGDISKLEISPVEVIRVVEDCYRQAGLGLAQDSPRMEIRVKGKDLPHIAPGTTGISMGMAYLEESGILVMSESYQFGFRKYVNKIIDPETGEIIAIINRGGTKRKKISTGSLRTGAAAAVGTKYLAKDKIEAVGVVGTGRIGQASLLCLSKIKEFETVYAHSGRRMDLEFPKIMSELVDAEIIPVNSVKETVENCDVLVTATFAQDPIISGSWLKPGTHICGMGADGPLKSELDPEVFRRASKIYIDGKKCLEIGEVTRALKTGSISPESITGLIGELVAGKKPSRASPDEITVFESDGTHMQSASVVGLIYNKVKEAGLGIEVKRVADFFYNP
jgi:alanine dehydrogenase